MSSRHNPPKARDTTQARPKLKATGIPRFKPAPEWIKKLFANVISHFPEAETRKMFGYPCAFVNDQMMCGVYADRMMLRLSAEDRAGFLKLKGAKPFEPTPGRPMKEYVEAPPGMLTSTAELRKWLKKSVAYTRSLPPKEKKK